MKVFLATFIPIASVITYFVVAALVGRAFARWAYRDGSEWTRSSRLQDAREAFWWGGLFWPLSWIVLAVSYVIHSGWIEGGIPEIREQRERERADAAEKELKRVEQSIRDLHRDLGIGEFAGEPALSPAEMRVKSRALQAQQKEFLARHGFHEHGAL